jgi:hypothetical protein
MKLKKINIMIISLVNFTGGAAAQHFAPQLAALATNAVTRDIVASIGLGIASHWLYDLIKGRKSSRAFCGTKRLKISRTRGASPSTSVQNSSTKSEI